MNRSSAGAVVTYFLYQRNANGASTRVTHEDGTFTYYQYDALDRLTQEHRVTNPTVYGFQYEYDQASRRTSRYNLANDSQVLYSLDTRGLLREENEPDVDITTYEWDAAQRLVTRTGLTTATSYAHDQRDQVKEFTLEGFGSGTNHQFHYTGLGERVVMVGGVGGTTPTYLAYDGGRLVTERGAGGTNYQALRWSPKGEVVDELDSGVGSAKAPVTDAQGSVGRLPGVAGGRIYDAFGVEWASSLSSSTRAAFLPGAFLRLNSVPYQIGLTRGGLYLASVGIKTLASSQRLQSILLGSRLWFQAIPPPWLFASSVPARGPNWDPNIGGPDLPDLPGPRLGINIRPGEGCHCQTLQVRGKAPFGAEQLRYSRPFKIFNVRGDGTSLGPRDTLWTAPSGLVLSVFDYRVEIVGFVTGLSLLCHPDQGAKAEIVNPAKDQRILNPAEDSRYSPWGLPAGYSAAQWAPDSPTPNSVTFGLGTVAWRDQFGIHNILPRGNYLPTVLQKWRAWALLKGKFKVTLFNSDWTLSPDCVREYEIHGETDGNGRGNPPPILTVTK